MKSPCSNLFRMMQIHKIFIPNIFFYQINGIFLDLFAKNMKGWSHKKIIFYFFCKFDLPRKKLENNNFVGAALLYANIYQIFFFSSGSSKIFAAVYLRICSTGPLIFPHPSASVLEFQLILLKKSTTSEMGFNSYPNISQK